MTHSSKFQFPIARLGTIVPADSKIEASLISGSLGVPAFAKDEDVEPLIKEKLSNSSQFDYDIVVIGTGPGGYVAAIRAAQLGARVAVIEKEYVGGVCLNVGCIPTKTLLSCVGVLDHIRAGEDFGVRVSDCGLDIPLMMKRKDETVKQLTSGISGLFRKNKIKMYEGFGEIAGSHTIKIKTVSGEDKITSGYIIIASGSVPAKLPLDGFEIGDDVWTSTEALKFTQLPSKMAVIGAGAIGLEFGYTFARLNTDVTVIEMMEQILPFSDTETANALQKSLEHAGMKFMLGTSVVRAEDSKNGKKVYLKKDDKEETLEVDKILVAVGRKPVIEGIGLEKVGIKTDGKKILVNKSMQTSVPNIYAIGDCIGDPMLAHVGWTEGVVAVEHALGMNSVMDYKVYPMCVYTTPEFACCGLTEEKAKELYNDVNTGKFSFSHNGKAMGMGETEGFVKFIAREKYGEVLGCSIVGPHATDLISEAVIAIKNELTIDEIINTIHPHPTLAEVVQEAAMDVKKRSIHK